MTTALNKYLPILKARRAFFNEQLPSIPILHVVNIDDKKNTCPVCGYPTLETRCSFGTCPICWWEDDGQDDNNADEEWGGPNGSYTLNEYRTVFYERLNLLKSEDRAQKEIINSAIELKQQSGEQIDKKELITNINNLFAAFSELEIEEKGLKNGVIKLEQLKHTISIIDNLSSKSLYFLL